MPVNMAQVRAALEPEEPNYPQAAALGPEALPHLQTLVREADPMIASKAAYLAALIDPERSADVLKEAAKRENPVIRVAAAAAARHLPGPQAADLLASLVSDEDHGVREVAMKSIQADPTGELRASLETRARTGEDPRLRDLSRETLSRLALLPEAGAGQGGGTAEGGGMSGGGTLGQGEGGGSLGGAGGTSFADPGLGRGEGGGSLVGGDFQGIGTAFGQGEGGGSLEPGGAGPGQESFGQGEGGGDLGDGESGGRAAAGGARSGSRRRTS